MFVFYMQIWSIDIHTCIHNSNTPVPYLLRNLQNLHSYLLKSTKYSSWHLKRYYYTVICIVMALLKNPIISIDYNSDSFGWRLSIKSDNHLECEIHSVSLRVPIVVSDIYHCNVHLHVRVFTHSHIFTFLLSWAFGDNCFQSTFLYFYRRWLKGWKALVPRRHWGINGNSARNNCVLAKTS